MTTGRWRDAIVCEKALAMTLALIAMACGTMQAATSGSAAEILKASGVSGGLVVHVGCGDGKLTAALRAGEGWLVHGLVREAASGAGVAAAREHVRSVGLYGAVSIDRFDGRALPYVDNLVNLVVAEDLGGVAMAEVMRVLAPGGVAYLKTGGAWTKTVKPRPAEIDEWTHYLHGSDNNAVANDTVIGPPRRLQWQCGPKWTRHHDRMSSFSAMVSTGGWIFYIFDEGSSASIYLPSRWALIARDAFNGKLLWKRKIDTWYNRHKGLKDGPADAPRRLVAAGGRVYATLDLHGPVIAMDAVTGETVREYAGTEGAEEIVLSDGSLFVLVGPGSIGDGKRLTRPVEKRTLIALAADTGRTLWRTTDVVGALTTTVDADGVYYFNFDSKHVVCLDRRTGRRKWASADALPAPERQTSFFASKLVVSDGVVLLASGEYSGLIKSTGGANKADTLTAMSAATGETLWTAKHPPSGYSSPEDLFVIDGTVWCGTVSSGGLDGTVIGWDLKTGREKSRFPADEKNYWFHHRCHPGRATTNFLLTSRTGIEFIDFRKQHWDLNHWVRGACLYGIMPANGLVYAPPSPCACYSETYLHNFNALAPASQSAPQPLSDATRLTKGPAFSGIPQSAIRPSTGSGPDGNPKDWPTYRGSNARSGATSASVPAKLAPAWKANLGGKLSALTAAEGRVFVAAVDRHTVHALDAGSGRELWRFTAGGRVDSPPTYHQGRVLFGSADGRVYCLRASDGELAWRFQAAIAERRIVAHEQVESLWPVHGSVLVRQGVAHFVAGRSIFVDGGMWLWRLDAGTGRIVSKTVLDEKNPKTGENIQKLVKWLNMPVGRPDVLSCDDKRIYMRSQAFDLAGKRLAMGPTVASAQEGAIQGGEQTHLFCPTGFLDDTSFHRTYWMYGRTFSSGWCGYYVAGKHAPAGKIMCVGEDKVYAFGRQPQYYKWTVPMEFRLFSAEKLWKAPPPQTPADRRGVGQPARGGAAAKGAAAKEPKDVKRKRKPATPGPVTNQANYAWSTTIPVLVRAMALADGTLFVAGPRDMLDEAARGKTMLGTDKAVLQQEAALLGRDGAVLLAVSAEDGQTLGRCALDAPPVFDGMAVTPGRLFVSTIDGKVVCLQGAK